MAETHRDKELEPPGEREATIDPGRLIIDSHHHLWPRYRVFGYSRDEYAADASTHAVVASVFAECVASYDRQAPEHLRPVGETTYVVGHCPRPLPGAAEPFVAAGIVSRVDLLLDAREVRDAFEAHLAAGQGRFKGIRYSTIAWSDPDVLPGNRRNAPEIMRSDRFRAGFAELAALGLTFDAWLAFTQLAEVAELADAFPDTPIVINHLGGPINPSGDDDERARTFRQWRNLVADVAQRPNVNMKLGGVGMSVFGLGYEGLEASPSSDVIAADWSPYINACLESFGPARCMFESNFSPDKAGVTFHNQWNAFKKMTASCSESEKDQLFRRTAERFYSLPQLVV